MRRALGWLMSAAAFAASLSPPAAAAAETYPTRPVKLVVGFAPGGSNDILARIVGDKLTAMLGQPFVVENKPGAGGMLAATSVMGSTPDGYTLLVGASGAMSIAPSVYTRMQYDTLKNFVPVSILGTFPLLLVASSDGPAKTVSELVAYSRANPDKANYASVSPTFTLAGELFKLKTGARLQRVSYRGSNDAVVAVLSGQVTATIADPSPALPLIQDGKLRALAVTSKTRIPELPDVPTMAEAGVAGGEALIWTGLFAPKGTPPAVLAKLEAGVARAMSDPSVKEKMRKLSTDAASSTSAAFATFIAQDIDSWTKVANDANVRIDP